jgi:twitching motility protein PilT
MKLALQLAAWRAGFCDPAHQQRPGDDRPSSTRFREEQPQVRGMLAEILVGIVAQQLLKRKNGSGDMAAHEILVGGPALSAMIREGKTFRSRQLGF